MEDSITITMKIATFTLVVLASAVAAQGSQKPNIIVIIADDIGWNDFSYHGSSQIPTPNIDALGYNGIILHGFYTQHICSPSRAAFLTGNYPLRSGFQGLPLSAGENKYIPLDMPTMPERLKELGYSTHMVGKWHLGAAYRNVTPTGRGFDTHFGYWNGYTGYFDLSIDQDLPNNLPPYFGFDLHERFTPVWSCKNQYATELFTKKSLELIDEHDTSRPLFLVLSHLAAHTGQNGTELGVPDEEEAQRKYSYIGDHRRRLYADVVNIMDESVGQLVAKLREKEMLENSIILFFSDNGAQTFGIYANSGSNWPLRGLKFTLYEGGLRGSATIYSPLFAKKGYVSQELVHITDFLPTFYAAAGGDVKELGKIDGIDQWEVLSSNIATKRTEVLLNVDELNGFSGIVVDKGNYQRYKLVNGTYKDSIYDQHYGDNGRGPAVPPYDLSAVLESATNQAIRTLNQQAYSLDEAQIRKLRSQVDISECNNNTVQDDPPLLCKGYCLFDLTADPCETTNVIGELSEIAEELKIKLDGYARELVPQGIRIVDLSSDPKRYNGTWCTWLDDEICYKNSQEGQTSFYLAVPAYLVVWVYNFLV